MVENFIKCSKQNIKYVMQNYEWSASTLTILQIRLIAC